jgi:NAD(P)-dependent dehydrogenase (short-subunit alcohol dehydrogenase family)
MSFRATFDFSGAGVVVVGASRAGIGAAVARAFQDAGAIVTITGVEPEPAAEDRDRFAYVQLDVRDLAAVRGFAERFDGLDVLVNCAAVTARGEEMDPDFFAGVVDINLFGTFRTARAFQTHLAARGGTLINIASMYARFGSPRNPAYGASKAGVEQLTKSLAIAWAPDGIRVNAVAPGFIVTEQSARSRADPAHVASVSARTPLGRWGEPGDIAGTVLFLASSASRFVTGACLPVDGGYSVV